MKTRTPDVPRVGFEPTQPVDNRFTVYPDSPTSAPRHLITK